jgi:hypothetical protein
MCRAAQPLAAIAASRYALGADVMDALRARAPAAARSRPRAARSATMARAPRARAPACAPPITRALPLSCEDVEDVVGFALLESPVQGALRAPAEGEGGEGCFRHHHARACGGTLACYRSMFTARVGAPRHCNRSALYPQARLIPRTLSACSEQSPHMIGVMTISS